MQLSFCIIGSGSRGNGTLVVCSGNGHDRLLLIDCGLSPRATAARLGTLGIELEEISDIALTHLDCDHFHRGWSRIIDGNDIQVHVHRRHQKAAVRRGVPGRSLHVFDGAFSLDGCTQVEPVLLAHDQLGAVGFVIDHGGRRLGYATDLGRVPSALLESFQGLHALALESNYDRVLEMASDRPVFLKRRIMGGSGHLSNDESIEAVLHIDGHSTLSHVVPLHLSEQCNHPRLVKTLYARRAPHLLDCLTISNQRRLTPLLQVLDGVSAARRSPRFGEQLAMF